MDPAFCCDHDLHGQSSRREAGGVVTRLIAQRAAERRVSLGRLDSQRYAELALIDIEILAAAHLQAEVRAGRILLIGDAKRAGIELELGGDQKLVLRLVGVDVEAGLDAKAQLDILRLVRGELQRVCQQLDVLLLRFGCAIESTELNLRGCDERKRQREADGKDAALHAPPAAMVFWMSASICSLLGAPAVTSTTLPERSM